MSTAVATRRGNPNGNPQNLRGGGSLPRFNTAEIVKLWKADRTADQIADEIGCNEVTVYRHLRSVGISKPKPSFTPDEVALIERLLEEDCPYTEIAKTIGTTRSIIEHRWPGRGIRDSTERLLYARARRDFERLVRRLGLDDKEER